MRTFLLSLCFLAAGCPGGLCGDGSLDAGEACDDGNSVNADGCEADCSLPSCQNSIVDFGELCLFASTELETDEAPSDIITADLNGDGLPDIATANAGGQSLSVFLGDGAGGFARVSDVELGVFGFSLAGGDFDGDGSLDLAAALTGVNRVEVFRGLGDGSFAPLATLSSSFPETLAVGDWNGDGVLDLVAGGTGIDIFLNSGAGGFLAPRFIPTQAGVAGLVVGDFDGSGSLDLVATLPAEDSLLVSLGDGLGNFSTQPRQAAGDSPGELLSVDLNGDGSPDLVVGRRSITGEVGVFTGNGSGLFSETQTSSVAGVAGLAAGDLNGDGALDVAVASDLDLTFTSHLALLLVDGVGGLSALPPLPASNGNLTGVVSADFNGDGALDAVLSDSSNSRLFVFFSRP